MARKVATRFVVTKPIKMCFKAGYKSVNNGLTQDDVKPKRLEITWVYKPIAVDINNSREVDILFF